MKNLKVGLLIAALIVFGTQFAHAQEQKKEQDPEKRFAKIDTNSDGKLDREEFKIKMAGKKSKDGKVIDIDKLFAKKDKNSDGYIDLLEFTTKNEGKKTKTKKE